MKLSPFLLIIAFLAFFPSCGNESSNTSTGSPPLETPTTIDSSQVATPLNLRIQTFQNEDQSWGYDVYLNEKRYIHQPHQPAVGGKEGFKTEAHAQQVAAIVEEKIRKGIMPPSVTPEEVQSVTRGE